MHIDKFNKGKNIVLPLKLPQHGGGLFVELCLGDQVTGKVEIYQDGSAQVAGQVFSLKEGEPLASIRRPSTQLSRGPVGIGSSWLPTPLGVCQAGHD